MALRHHEDESGKRRRPLLPIQPRDFNESLFSYDMGNDLGVGGYPLSETTRDIFGTTDSGDLSNALNRYVVDVFKTNDRPAGFLIFAGYGKGIHLFGSVPAVREEDFSPLAKVF